MAHIKIVSVTQDGAAAAAHIAAYASGALVERYDRNGDKSLENTQFSRFVQQSMVDCDMVIFIGSFDENVRLIAPYIANSGYDPAVLCADEAMTSMVQLLKSRKEEINAFAEQLAYKAEMIFIA